MKVGFIGLGAMGLPMARNLVNAGHEVLTVVHRARGPAEELATRGARILKTPAEIGKAAAVVMTILPADAELEEVVEGPQGLREGLSSRSILVEMTSAKPETLLRLAAPLADRGIRVLDAPVSGGTAKAASGELTIMAGGDHDVLEEVRGLLKCMAREIHHVGGLGQGKTVKMVNQLLAAIHIAAIGECFALGIKNGSDPQTLYRVIKESSGYSRMMDARLPGFLFEDAFSPGFKLSLMSKDVSIAVESAREKGCPLFLGSIVSQLLTAAGAEKELDFSVVARYVSELSGVSLKKTGAGEEDHGRSHLPN